MREEYILDFEGRLELFLGHFRDMSRDHYSQVEGCGPVIIKQKLLTRSERVLLSDDMNGKLAYIDCNTGDINGICGGNKSSKRIYGNIYDEDVGMKNMGPRGPSM